MWKRRCATEPPYDVFVSTRSDAQERDEGAYKLMEHAAHNPLDCSTVHFVEADRAQVAWDDAVEGTYGRPAHNFAEIPMWGDELAKHVRVERVLDNAPVIMCL